MSFGEKFSEFYLIMKIIIIFLVSLAIMLFISACIVGFLHSDDSRTQTIYNLVGHFLIGYSITCWFAAVLYFGSECARLSSFYGWYLGILRWFILIVTPIVIIVGLIEGIWRINYDISYHEEYGWPASIERCVEEDFYDNKVVDTYQFAKALIEVPN